MPRDYATTLVRRSRLIMPAHQKRFVEKAYTRNADAVVLDLEDSVPDTEKTAARESLAAGVALAGKGGSEIIIRVNNTRELLADDLEAAVRPGVSAIYMPKCETAEEITELAAAISRLEKARGMATGAITVNAVIETPRGYLNAEAIAAASERIDSITLGNEDFCSAISLVSDQDTQAAMLSIRMRLLVIARAHGQIPMGLIGSMTAYSNESGFETLAKISYKHGFLGASCIHPGNVATLNACFSPSPEEVASARELTLALDAAFAKGEAAITLNGKMVDIAHYKKAEALLNRAAAIEAHETRKRMAREAAR